MPCLFAQPIGLTLGGRQGLGHQRIVVDRHSHQPQTPQQRGERVRGQRDRACGHPAVLADHVHAVPVGVQRDRLGLLEDPHALVQAGLAQPPGQPGRLDQAGPLTLHQAREVRRGGDLGTDRVGVEELRRLAVLGHQVRHLAQLVDLVRLPGHRQLPGLLPGAVDVVALDRLGNLLEVGQPQLLELVQLLGPALQSVGESVRQAGVGEAAVASAGLLAAHPRLDQDDVSTGVALLGDQRGPEPGVAAADDTEVGRDRLGQPRQGRGPVGVVEPGHQGLGSGERFGGPAHVRTGARACDRGPWRQRPGAEPPGTSRCR